MTNETIKQAWLKLIDQSRHYGDMLHELIWDEDLRSSTKALGIETYTSNLTLGTTSYEYEVRTKNHATQDVMAAADALKILYEHAKASMNSVHTALKGYDAKNLDELTATKIGKLKHALETKGQETQERLSELSLSDDAKKAIRYDDFLNIASGYIDEVATYQQARLAYEEEFPEIALAYDNPIPSLADACAKLGVETQAPIQVDQTYLLGNESTIRVIQPPVFQAGETLDSSKWTNAGHTVYAREWKENDKTHKNIRFSDSDIELDIRDIPKTYYDPAEMDGPTASIKDPENKLSIGVTFEHLLDSTFASNAKKITVGGTALSKEALAEINHSGDDFIKCLEDVFNPEKLSTERLRKALSVVTEALEKTKGPSGSERKGGAAR